MHFCLSNQANETSKPNKENKISKNKQKTMLRDRFTEKLVVRRNKNVRSNCA
jgi:hypothetical protein